MQKIVPHLWFDKDAEEAMLKMKKIVIADLEKAA